MNWLDFDVKGSTVKVKVLTRPNMVLKDEGMIYIEFYLQLGEKGTE